MSNDSPLTHDQLTDDHYQVAGWIKVARRVVAFTGAGISTESGVPDFRSPGGIWATSQPVLYQDYISDPASRYEAWRQKSIAHRDFRDCQPNAGHRVLAKWEAAGRLTAVITQNIDGFHQIAGSRRVLEIHGTAREIVCLECAARFPADPMVEQFLATDRVPTCPKCGGMVKHATISFGQSLDADVLQESVRLSEFADLFLAIGSSLVVEPAAGLPRRARAADAKLVIINRTPTPQDGSAHLLFRTGIGETLTAIDMALERDG